MRTERVTLEVTHADDTVGGWPWKEIFSAWWKGAVESVRVVPTPTAGIVLTEEDRRLLAIAGEHAKGIVESCLREPWGDGWKNIAFAIAGILSRDAAAKAWATGDGWVSVNESLPKPGTRVLVVDGDGWVMEAKKTGASWVFGIGEARGVTHWMPLPSPPDAAAKAGEVIPKSVSVSNEQPAPAEPVAWVRVADELPVVGLQVLITALGWMRIAYWNGVRWECARFSSDSLDVVPTHWMKLPWGWDAPPIAAPPAAAEPVAWRPVMEGLIAFAEGVRDFAGPPLIRAQERYGKEVAGLNAAIQEAERVLASSASPPPDLAAEVERLRAERDGLAVRVAALEKAMQSIEDVNRDLGRQRDENAERVAELEKGNWLTAEELEVLVPLGEETAQHAGRPHFLKHDQKAVIRSLLARSAPPSVVHPAFVETHDAFRNCAIKERDAEWQAANAAAGVAVRGNEGGE